MKKIFAVLAIALSVAALSRSQNRNGRQELRVVPSVDLARYAGRWYEIARLPNRFQRSCAGEVTANYTLRDDGKVTVVNECRRQNGNTIRAEGLARPTRHNSTAKLEVRFAPSFLSFLPLVWGDYWIVDLASNYSYAVVGTPDRRYFWILSRTPQMDDATYQGIVSRAAAQNFDTSRVVRTRQTGG